MILLSPGLDSNLLVKQYEKKGPEFFCYCNNYANCRIQLWSNMNIEKQWTGFPMTPMSNSQHYKVIVHTFHLLPGDYEFTLRFTTTSDEPWSWYGKPGNNGRIRIVPRSICNNIDIHAFFSQSELAIANKQYIDGVQLWHYQTQRNPAEGERSFPLGSVNHPIHHYVAFLRKGSSWLTPVCGKSNFDKHSKHEKWQLLLYQDSTCGDVHLWMAIGHSVDCWLSPGQNSELTLNMRSNTHGAADLFICSTKGDYTQLIKVALNYYRKSIRGEKETCATRQLSRADTEMLDTLGYCTWNAFGKDVSEANLHQAMEGLKAHNIPVSYLLIDDGWQDVLDDKLVSEDTNKNKFPRSLKGTVANMKTKYPHLKRVGVWHALWGYWDGVHPDLGEKFGGKTISNFEGKDVGIMTCPDKFYKSFYSQLQQAGVDFVKVDNQSAFQGLVDTSLCDVGVYKLWDDYRKAVVEYADKYLECGVRHCMSLTPHVLFKEMLSTKKVSIFRSSDDYFPDEEDSHAWHIYANVINALLLSQYPVVCDWDMFQSDHPFSEYHATSRAISGGPVYTTDIPNKHNIDTIQRLVAQTKNNEYTLLRSAQVALPTFETVFGNVMEHKDLICLYNTHHENGQELEEAYEYGVCGFWSTGHDDRLGIVSSSVFRSKALAHLPTVAYVVSGPERGRCILLEPYKIIDEDSSSSSNHAISVRVPGLTSTLVSLSPVRTLGILSVACLGLVDKFNSTKSIIRTSITKENDRHTLYEAFLSHRSNQCGFWITATTRRKRSFVIPQRITIDNQELISGTDWTYNEETGLLYVYMTVVELDVSPTRSDFHIQIHFDFMQDATM